MAALGLLLAYLAGSFPTAWLVGRARGVDLGAVGSGNYGATNVFRNLGWGPALVVVAVDVAKGFLPVELFPGWLPAAGLSEVAYQVLLAIAAVLGHVFSVFLGFRGGKGVATAGGVFLALAPQAVLPALVVWLVMLRIWRMVSLASIGAAITLIVALAVTEDRMPVLVLGIVVACLVIYAHRRNIGRIIRGPWGRT